MPLRIGFEVGDIVHRLCIFEFIDDNRADFLDFGDNLIVNPL